MSEALILAGSMLAGVLLGALFFGGLWWTIRSSLHRNGLDCCSPQAFYSEWPSHHRLLLVSHGEWRKW